MQHIVDVGFDFERDRDIVVDELEIRMVIQLLDVFQLARYQIVHTRDSMTFGQEPLAEVGAEKTGTACNH